jgi:hypothetical protein
MLTYLLIILIIVMIISINVLTRLLPVFGKFCIHSLLGVVNLVCSTSVADRVTFFMRLMFHLGMHRGLNFHRQQFRCVSIEVLM